MSGFEDGVGGAPLPPVGEWVTMPIGNPFSLPAGSRVLHRQDGSAHVLLPLSDIQRRDIVKTLIGMTDKQHDAWLQSQCQESECLEQSRSILAEAQAVQQKTRKDMDEALHASIDELHRVALQQMYDMPRPASEATGYTPSLQMISVPAAEFEAIKQERDQLRVLVANCRGVLDAYLYAPTEEARRALYDDMQEMHDDIEDHYRKVIPQPIADCE